MFRIITTSLSILTLICAAVFAGLVLRWDNDMLHGLWSTVVERPTWVWIMVTVIATLVFAFIGACLHLLRHPDRISIGFNKLAIFDCMTGTWALAGWLTWLIYFYHSLKIQGVSFGSVAFNGAELAVGIVTCCLAYATALFSFCTREK